MGTIEPEVFVEQRDGSDSQYVNCGPASESMAVERDWLSTKVGDASNIRDWITAHFDSDQVFEGVNGSWPTSSGTTMSMTRRAISALYGTTVLYRYGFNWDTIFPSVIVGGSGATCSVIFGDLYGTNSTARHRVFINERRWNSTLGRYEYLVYDPWKTGKAWLSGARVKQAMVAAGTEMNVTRNTEQHDRKILFSGAHLRDIPSSGGVDGGALAKGDIVTYSGPALKGQSVFVSGGGTSDLWVPIIAKAGVLLPVTYYVPVVYIRPA